MDGAPAYNIYFVLLCFMYNMNILVCVSRNSNSERSLYYKSATLINDLLLLNSRRIRVNILCLLGLLV